MDKIYTQKEVDAMIEHEIKHEREQCAEICKGMPNDDTWTAAMAILRRDES